MRQYPDYVCRVTADEGAIGGGHLSRFQELETVTPVILTTSQLLTTGVDAPTCKNIVLARVIGSMTDFKQIIGRGTRVREDYGKLFFNIIDYTGSATRLFADPDFDGEPALIDEEVMDADGEVVEQTVVEDENQGEDGAVEVVLLEFTEQEPPERRKYYFDGGSVQIAAQVVYELDGEGKQLRVVSYTDYARRQGEGALPIPRVATKTTGANERNAARSSMHSRSAASSFNDSARSRASPSGSPRPALSSRLQRATSNPAGARRTAWLASMRTSSIGMAQKRARSFTSSSKSTPSTGSTSSGFPMSSRCLRSRSMGTRARLRPCLAAPISSGRP